MAEPRSCGECDLPVANCIKPNTVRFYCPRCEKLTVIVVPIGWEPKL